MTPTPKKCFYCGRGLSRKHRPTPAVVAILAAAGYGGTDVCRECSNKTYYALTSSTVAAPTV
jgi:hypothetical protein